MRAKSNNFLKILFFAILSFNYFVIGHQIVPENNLKAIIIVTKHGEKAVETSYPTDPYLNNEKYWPNGLNQLTNKGKEDCTALGRILKQKYGKYFKDGPNNLIGVSDKSPFSVETIYTVLTGLFGWSSSFVSSGDYKELLFGPERCLVLNRRINKALKSSEVRSLFKENKQLIQNITGSRKNDPKLIRNVPIVYESIETELNNYLPQPSWLNETRKNTLEQITMNLDKILYTNEFINQLQVGELLKEIRLNLIENSLKLPNIDHLKLGYMYVVGSDQFSALLNSLNIYESRPKFSSSFVIELDEHSNIKINYYDAKSRTLSEKHVNCDDKEVGCKLVQFLNRLDRLIPINVSKSCILPKPRLIKPDYDKLFKDTAIEEKENESKPYKDKSKDKDELKDNQSDDDDNENDNDNDNTDLEREQKKERQRKIIKNFIEKKFDEMINKNKELISWLSDLFSRRNEKRAKNQRDSEDELRERLIEILKEKVKQIDNSEKRKKLNQLINKWLDNKPEANDSKNLNDKNSKQLIENFENKIKAAITEKESTKRKQRETLIKLLDKIKDYSQLNSLQKAEKMEEFKQKINGTIKETKVKFDEVLDNLRISVQDLLEDKFYQIKDNYDEKKLKLILYDIETKLTGLIEECKLRREKKLNEIKNEMNKLVDDDDLIESDKLAKFKEIKDKILNYLDKEDEEEKLMQNKFENNQYSDVSKLIERIPNENPIQIDEDKEIENDEQLKVEKIKEMLKKIEANIMEYLKKNKENRKQIEEDLAKFNDFIQSNKKFSIGILTRLARLIDNEEIREEIKDTINKAIDFVNQTNRSLLTVETDLTTLISEILETNKNVSKEQFDLMNYQSNLNLTQKPTTKLLRAENPNSIDTTPAFSAKVFGITIAIVFGTLACIVIACLVVRKVKKRRDYTMV